MENQETQIEIIKTKNEEISNSDKRLLEIEKANEEFIKFMHLHRPIILEEN